MLWKDLVRLRYLEKTFDEVCHRSVNELHVVPHNMGSRRMHALILI